MLRLALRLGRHAVCVALALAVCSGPSGAVSIDKDGTIKLGVRAYVNVRIGTEATDEISTPKEQAGTFPFSPAGHVRQNGAPLL